MHAYIYPWIYTCTYKDHYELLIVLTAVEINYFVTICAGTIWCSTSPMRGVGMSCAAGLTNHA